MATLTCQIVRPDKMLFEGEVTSAVLVTHTGELGVYPGHAAEICSLGDGVMRLACPPDENGVTERLVAVYGGYAEIANDTIIVLATHARNADDIEPEVVARTRAKAQEKRDGLPKDDHRRAYYDEKIAWCDLLARVAEQESGSARA